MLPDITKRIKDKVKRTIEEHGMLAPKQHIVVGLSGGPDSVCLFHVLMSLREEMELTIHPVHVNHRFRPGDAEKDQAYVEQLCQSYGVTCSSFVVDCNDMAKRLHMTGEEAGRKARYDAFYKVAEELAEDMESKGWTKAALPRDSIKIAVAQNANDQAETVLFRLMRGAGTDGLAGMAYMRQERGFQVIRPVLDLYREEIEDYCSHNNLEPVTDHTNNQAIYARNKIRLELLPYLEKEYNENIKEALVRLSATAAEDKDYLWKKAEGAYRILLSGEEYSEAPGLQPEEKAPSKPGTSSRIIMNRQQLAGLHDAIRHRVIAKAFQDIGLDRDLTRERIMAADDIIGKKQGSKTVQFPHGYVLTVAKGQVCFEKK